MPRRRIEVLAAVVGAASLGAEIAAARLLAPWFGASTIVWANTIATVLVALSVGYWVGGRLADRDPTLAGLSRVVLCAAALLALVPFVAGPFLRISVEALDRVQAGAFVGSLIGVLVLVAVPVMLLGAVAPYAVRLSVRTVEEAGRVAGRLYAISTIGSLVGTFLSALAAHPARRHAAHVPGLRAGARRRRRPGAAAALRPGAGRRWRSCSPSRSGTVKATGDARVIWDRETEYQYARVTERPNGERRLELNEGQAVHSVYRPGEWLTDDYWDEMLVLPFATERAPAALDRDPRQRRRHDRARLRPLLPGDARRRRGDRPGADRRRAPALRPARAQPAPAHRRRAPVPAPVVAALGRDRRRRLPPALHPLLPVDPRVLRRGARPPHAGRRWCSSTSGTRATPTAWRRSSAPRWAGSSRASCAIPVKATNTVLVGTDAPASARALRRGDALAAPRPRGGERRRPPRGWRPRCAAARVYTDDRAPVEWLIDASIVHVAAEGDR